MSKSNNTLSLACTLFMGFAFWCCLSHSISDPTMAVDVATHDIGTLFVSGSDPSDIDVGNIHRKLQGCVCTCACGCSPKNCRECCLAKKKLGVIV